MNQSAILALQTATVERVCRLSLQARDGGYVVQVARGRRGAVLQTETKTPEPIAYEHARRIYAALLSKKTAQGYILEPVPTAPVAGTALAPRIGLRPLSPVPLAVAAAGALIASPDWWMQESLRGRHVLIHRMGGAVTATDVEGALVPLPAAVIDAVARIPLRCIVEGVLDEVNFIAFDLPQFETLIYRSLPYDVRLGGLRSLLPENNPDLTIAETATELGTKVELLQRLRAGSKVGFVLKRKHGVGFTCGPTVGDSMQRCVFDTN